MIQTKLPAQISYPNILPKGFPNVFKQWNIDPMSSNKQWSNNDIVRFNFMNMGKGVFDPYKSYIEITVSVNQNDLPVGLLQIDNSAQSFIKQTVLYSDNKQIQRINQYSVLAAYLNDIGLNQFISQGRQTQGLGYGSFDTMPFSKPQNHSNSAPRYNNSNQASVGFTSGWGTIYPTIGSSWGETPNYLSMNSIFSASKISKGHVSNSNPIMTNTDPNGGSVVPTDTALQMSLNLTGYANNIRAQYNAKFVQPKYPQKPSSIPNYQILLQNSVANGKYPIIYSQTNPYIVTSRGTWQNSLQFNSSNDFKTHTVNCANFGFTSLFTPFFTRGTFQPVISQTLPQCSILNGIIQPSKSSIYRRKFKLPLISSVIGVLIDPSQFLLIPLQAINTLLLQITLDPYAMFTSGYCDYSEIDTTGMNVQQQRCYTIQRIRYNMQTYHFLDSQIQKYIQNSLVKQISIISNFWSMSNQYQIPGGSGPNNTYIVGCNSTHLNQLLCLFVSNDYQTYSFARKHYRLSNNITQFWSKIAVDYWPPQPYKGNGGNVTSNNIDDDNSVFLQNIYWSGNFMFSKAALPRLNQYNFAINQRPYNIGNKATFYDPGMYNNQTYTFTSTSVNADTAMGMPWIHQNRVVGKAAYLISYTPFSQEDQILQGINVSSINNYQAIFNCDTNAPYYPNDQTLYIFTRSSGVVKYGANGIKTYGRG